jgi:hypothetical protein
MVAVPMGCPVGVGAAASDVVVAAGLGDGVVVVATSEGEPAGYSAVVSACHRVCHRRHRYRVQWPGQIAGPETRSGVVIVAAKSADKKIFGMATVDVRLR